MSKIARFSKKGNMVQIPTSTNTAQWYFLADPVISFVKARGFKDGDDVEYEVDNPNQKTPTITKLWKVGQEPKNNANEDTPKEEIKEKKDEPKPTGSGYSGYSGQYQKPKTPEETNAIRKLAIGNMTSRALVALQGYISEENIEQIMEKVYNKFEKLTSN